MLLYIFILKQQPMKKIIFNEEQIKQIIQLYTVDIIGMAAIGKQFNVSREAIKRVLLENNINIDTPGQRFKGGKKTSDAKYYKKHKSKIQKYHKEWANNNREHLRDKHANWRQKNKEHVRKKARQWQMNKANNDIAFKINKIIRTALWQNLKENNVEKNERTFEILPFTLVELMSHLESQFTDGMTWENYGEWHIDHIIPLSSFNFNSINDFEFIKAWSLNNLRPLWKTNRIINGVQYFGNLNKGPTKNDSCFQYKMRELYRIKEEKTLPFNISDINLQNTEIQPIDRKTCEKIIIQYEWLGFLPKFTKLHYGIFFYVNGEKHLGGVLAFQNEYSSNQDTWEKYNISKDKIIQLSRGVCLWWTPINTASFFISKVCKLLYPQYEVITATVDPSANEIGKIYQSLNWKYIGLMPGNIKNTKNLTRLSVIIDNVLYGSRQIRSMFGTIKKDVILSKHPKAIFINSPRKRRYFYFLGDKRTQKRNTATLSKFFKPYPKTINDL